MNPWKDAAAYQIDDSQKYKGRDESINCFMQILREGTVAVLTANSGIGKTSFINAGICSRMIKRGYSPIKIRMRGQFNDKTEIEQFLLDTIRGDRNWKFKYENEIEEEKVRPLAKSLWWLLHAYELQDSDGNPLQPLLIFDQFEEVFYNSANDKRQGDYVELDGLFRVIQTFVTSSLPDDINQILFNLEEEGHFVDVNTQHQFKVIFSLRKEFLSDFDYWTNERFSIPDLLQNRMLLMPLTEEQALEVIKEQPLENEPEQYVTTLNNVAEEIVEKTRSSEEGVNPLILSIACSRLYAYLNQQKKKSELSKKDVDEQISVETCIMNFYIESVRRIVSNKRHVAKLENALIDFADGRRRHPRLEDIPKDVRGYIEELDEKHIIRQDKYGGNIYVELIHDKVAEAVVEKNKRESVIKNRKFIGRLIALLLTVLFVCYSVYSSLPRITTQVLQGTITGDALYSDVHYLFPTGEVHLDNCDFYGTPFQNNEQLKRLFIRWNSPINIYVYHWFCPQLDIVDISADSVEAIYDHFDRLRLLSLKRFSLKTQGYYRSYHSETLSAVHELNKNTYLDLDSHLDLTVNGHRYHNTLYKFSELNDSLQPDCAVFDISSDSVTPISYNIARNIRHLRLQNVKEIPNDFLEYHRENYTTIDLFLPSAQRIGKEAFQSYHIPYIYLPRAVDIGEDAFAFCHSNGVELPEVKRIGRAAFYDNYISYLYAPKVQSIGAIAFANCDSLRKVNFPLLEELDEQAFWGCDSLGVVSIPRVKYIGKEAFIYCYNLDTLFVSSDVGRQILKSPEEYGLSRDFVCAERNDSVWTLALLNKTEDVSWPADSAEIAHFSRKELEKNLSLRVTLSETDNIDWLSNNYQKFIKSIRLRYKWSFTDSPQSRCFVFENCVYSLHKFKMDNTMQSYHARYTLMALNSKRVVLMDDIDTYVSLGKAVKEVVLFSPSSYTKIMNQNNVVFLVPHGMKQAMPNEAKVKELSLAETYYYQSRYNYKRFICRIPYAFLDWYFQNGQIVLFILVFFWTSLLSWYCILYSSFLSFFHSLKPKMARTITLLSFILYIPISFITTNNDRIDYLTPLYVVISLQLIHLLFQVYPLYPKAFLKRILISIPVGIMFCGLWGLLIYVSRVYVYPSRFPQTSDILFLLVSLLLVISYFSVYSPIMQYWKQLGKNSETNTGPKDTE